MIFILFFSKFNLEFLILWSIELKFYTEPDPQQSSKVCRPVIRLKRRRFADRALCMSPLSPKPLEFEFTFMCNLLALLLLEHVCYATEIVVSPTSSGSCIRIFSQCINFWRISCFSTLDFDISSIGTVKLCPFGSLLYGFNLFLYAR